MKKSPNMWSFACGLDPEYSGQARLELVPSTRDRDRA